MFREMVCVIDLDMLACSNWNVATHCEASNLSLLIAFISIPDIRTWHHERERERAWMRRIFIFLIDPVCCQLGCKGFSTEFTAKQNSFQEYWMPSVAVSFERLRWAEWRKVKLKRGTLVLLGWER